MTEPQAVDLATYARQLFHRTSVEKLAALRDLIMPFPNPQFVRQTLMSLATETNDLELPKVRERLEAETNRKGETAEQKLAAAKAATDAKRQQFIARVDERARSRQEADELLNSLDDEELAMLHEEVSREMPFLAKYDPKVKQGVRRVMHFRLTRGQQHRMPERRQFVQVANVAADFDA